MGLNKQGEKLGYDAKASCLPPLTHPPPPHSQPTPHTPSLPEATTRLLTYLLTYLPTYLLAYVHVHVRACLPSLLTKAATRFVKAVSVGDVQWHGGAALTPTLSLPLTVTLTL